MCLCVCVYSNKIVLLYRKKNGAFIINVNFVFLTIRLHREALKQSAMDPKTGMIDINILTTGLSITDRKRRVDAAKALLELVKGKGRVATLNYYKLFEEFREQAEAVSCRFN